MAGERCKICREDKTLIRGVCAECREKHIESPKGIELDEGMDHYWD